MSPLSSKQKALTKAQMNAPEINSGIYAFTAADLWAHIERLSTDNAHPRVLPH